MAVFKSGFEIVKRAMLKELMKKGDDGIMLTLPKDEIVDLNARITMDRLIKAGVDPESLTCLLYTSPSPRDRTRSRMPSSA